VNAAQPARRIYRLDEISVMARMSRNQIHRAMLDEHFPLPIKLGVRSKGWWAHEVDAWLAGRPRSLNPCAEAPQYADHESESA
jgi:predicted DNA-binding transcriptional regulator AlpA